MPENVVTNGRPFQAWYRDTSDEWIQERTGIVERRYVEGDEDTTTTMGVKAARIAIERSGIDKDEIDFIICHPYPGLILSELLAFRTQRDLGLRTIGAVDVRNQYSGFVCDFPGRPVYQDGNV